MENLRDRCSRRRKIATLAPRLANILRRASIPKQLDGHGWNRQQEGDQDCSEIGHEPLLIPTGRLNAPNLLHEIAESDRRVLKTMSKVGDLRNRPSSSLVFALID